MASIPTQEEVLAATRKGQEAMMAAVKTWLDTVRTAAPKLPSKLSQVSLPFADKLPTPQDAVANAYHLAEQLLASQRRFAEELVKATAPLRPGYRESSPEVPSPSAWQDAVTDSEPKTPAVVAARKAAASTTPKAAESAAPKAAPARAAAKSTPVRTAPRTTAAKRTTAGSASTTGTSARKSTTASSAGAARKNAGTTTPAPKGTGKS
jgi:DNA-binding protein HU-beta